MKYITTNYTPQQWADDLMRGDFRRATRHLRKGGGFCCLGVLREQTRVDGAIVCHGTVGLDLKVLPDWFEEFHYDENRYQGNDLMNQLANRNDSIESEPTTGEWSIDESTGGVLAKLHEHFGVRYSKSRQTRLRNGWMPVYPKFRLTSQPSSCTIKS